MRNKLNKILVVYIIFILLFSCIFEMKISFAESESVQNQNVTNSTVTNETVANETTENVNVGNEIENITEESEEDKNEAEIEGLESQKSDLENQIASTEAQIGVVDGVLSKTLEEIEQLSTKIEQKRKEISNVEIQELSLMKLIEEEEIKLNETTEKYNKEKALLEKRLVIMYEMGKLNTLDVLLDSKNISDFLSRYYLLSEIGKADKKLLNNVKKDKNQTESITKSLTEKKRRT